MTPMPPVLDDPNALLRRMFLAAVREAQPTHRMAAYLPAPPKGGTVVLGAGKAGGAMAQALESLWPAQAPLSGLVVTRYGHVPPRAAGVPQRIEVVEAAHPEPDAAGRAAAERILALTQGLTADDLVICLISGGGSALMALPADGLTLADKLDINRQLLRSGAGIGDMNTVRKHLSRIKGGRLAAACYPASVLTLAISDVPGDDPSVVASGPTVGDPSTCADALQVIDRYGLRVPPLARARLLDGAWETPKPGDERLSRSAFHWLATPNQALDAAAQVAREVGLRAHVLGDDFEGETAVVARLHASLVRSVSRRDVPFEKPCVLLSGGETTVTLTGATPAGGWGRGGRAGEFALALAQSLDGLPGVWALAADTDGIDGVEDNAGAVIAPDTMRRAANQGLSASACLRRHDAYGFFASLGDLVVTGPTHTNVNDFRAILVT